ncbi:hypothetical protein B0G93_11834 [Bacillus sp. V-88]|nr:hypothetical protein B1B00_15870 [Bacillus sp. DSM 27956]PRX73916.1 hypothetical protein B0G93_11834 [Bacillus sp. V-88]SLK23992.1 hypothetical protein SAMN06295884_11834 [Bacillus sp. V-88]
MKTRFEKWYENNNFPGDAKILFEESVLCYKISAYRASFIMSYLGVQTVLRERLLNSYNKPNNIPQNMWEKKTEELKDDNAWDNTVFDLVNRTKPDNPYLIADDIRVQYSYWRTIRNDCAHAKSNIVSSPHVEALWLFIESNLNKFVVNGGTAGLLEKIKKHYDTKYTPPNTDVSPIVKEIPHTMTKIEIPFFLKEVDDLFEETVMKYSHFDEESETFDFWSYIANSEVAILREAFLEYIKSDWDIFRKFIVVFPGKLYEVSSDDKFIREFWSSEIWKLFKWGNIDGWKILKVLLDNKIIPTSELDNFIKDLYKKVKKNPPEFLIDFLKSTDYFKMMKASLFESEKMSRPYGIEFANQHWKRIRFYLKHMELDKVVVSELNAAYLASSYGEFNREMTKLFETDETFSQEYKKILYDENLKIPSILEQSE